MRAEYADRLRLGPLEIIVRDVDDQGEITALGVSLEPEPLTRPLPGFVSREALGRPPAPHPPPQGAGRRRRQSGTAGE